MRFESCFYFWRSKKLLQLYILLVFVYLKDSGWLFECLCYEWINDWKNNKFYQDSVCECYQFVFMMLCMICSKWSVEDCCDEADLKINWLKMKIIIIER